MIYRMDPYRDWNPYYTLPPYYSGANLLSGMPNTYSHPIPYPEIYYKLQPYILRACREMSVYGILTEEMIEEICCHICEEACRSYPEFEEYKNTGEENTNAETNNNTPAMYAYPYDWRRHTGRGGLLHDIVRILFLSRFFGGRRRRYY
jgi:hypothetical protein